VVAARSASLYPFLPLHVLAGHAGSANHFTVLSYGGGPTFLATTVATLRLFSVLDYPKVRVVPLHETNGIHLVLFGMWIRTLRPYLAANKTTLVSFLVGGDTRTAVLTFAVHGDDQMWALGLHARETKQDSIPNG
jgi:hypothetical protein